MADHFAEDDEHAISITRGIVASLNLGTTNNRDAYLTANGGSETRQQVQTATQSQSGRGSWDEPLFDPREMGSVIPTDPKKSFDVRKVSGRHLHQKVHQAV